MQIAGTNQALRLNEAHAGHYEGSYTVRARDRVTAASLVTARMVKDGRTVSAALDQSVVAGARSPASPVVANAGTISAFSVTAPDRLRAGEELNFSITGTPGGKARVAVKGVADRIPLTEVSRGVYEGNYTVRRRDHLDGALSATGFLMVNRQESSQTFERPFVAVGDAPRRDRVEDLRAVHSCANCGVIESVNEVEVKGGSSNALGTIAGGVIGGAIGNQVGGGSGRDLATIAGAIGGAYAGNRVQNNRNKSTEYQVVVRLENGSTQTFNYADDPAIKVGARVKVENNALVRL